MAPTAAVAGSVHLTAAGDFGSSAAATGVLAGMGAAQPDFHLALGDLSYGAPGTEQSWCDLVKSQVGSTPFELISGNHESNGLNGLIDNFAGCLPNRLSGLVGTYGKEWYVDVPAAAPVMRIVMISPNLYFSDGRWSYTKGSTHYNWTTAAIDGARSANIPWVVVGMHEPCLTMTAANCSSGPDLLNLLVAKKVDLVLSGHVHMYERTKQLATSTACPTITPNTSAAACVRDADTTMTQGGTVFATVGSGGEVEQHPTLTDPEAPYFATYNGVHSSAWGFLDVTADSNRLSASFTTTSGTPLPDSFTISRPNAPPLARFTSSCVGLACGFDASTSTDSDGSITSYAWDFGDGTRGTGVRPTHTYAVAGTRPVTLTVTDDHGATAVTTRQVTVAASGGSPGQVGFVGATQATGGAVKVEAVTVPAATRTGDTLVLAFSGSADWSAPSGVTGWTPAGSFVQGAITSKVWTRTATAADAGATVRITNAAYTKAALSLAVYSGVDPAGITTAHAGDTARSAHAGPAVGAPGGAWELSYWADKSASTTSWTAPAAVTVRGSVAGTGGGHFSVLLADSAAPVAAGPYGPLTAVASSTGSAAVAWTFTLPAAG
jgi:PKD repeat protein